MIVDNQKCKPTLPIEKNNELLDFLSLLLTLAKK